MVLILSVYLSSKILLWVTACMQSPLVLVASPALLISELVCSPLPL